MRTVLRADAAPSPRQELKRARRGRRVYFTLHLQNATCRVTAVSVLAAVLLTLTGCGRRPPPLRIMPLGDSITQGFYDDGSYRLYLWRKLREAGVRADFVGSQSTFHGSRKRYLGLDPDHEGHDRWKADEILARLPGWLATNRPDVVLVHLGTNDAIAAEPDEQILTELRGITAAIASAHPRPRIFLAMLIPCAYPGTQARISALNARIRAWGESAEAREQGVVVVDMSDVLDPAGDLNEGIHPNAAGAEKIAARWYEALSRTYGWRR